MKLTICIATYNRGEFIGETMDSILGQLESGVEIVVVDGASPDRTPEVMARYTSKHPEIRYFRETENSGVDADFDKAVGYARGEYCWLMTDDDLLRDGAIASVLSNLVDNDLVVVNAEVRNVNFSTVIEKRRLAIDVDRQYRGEDYDSFLGDAGNYLSFIGCVIIRRDVWLARDRAAYYGSLFIHVGVIFQNPPITNIRVIAEPLISIRYGNAMWTARSFEIWMFKWPKLIWSFPDFSDAAKRKVCRREPWRNPGMLFYNRALGAFSPAVFRKFWTREAEGRGRFIAYVLSMFPGSIANAVMVAYCSMLARPMPLELHDLLNSRNAGLLSRLLFRVLARGRF